MFKSLVLWREKTQKYKPDCLHTQGLGQVEKSGNGEEQMAHYFAAIEPNKFSPTLVVVAGTV